MSDTSKRSELVTNDGRLPSRAHGGLLDQAMSRLPVEQQDALMQKAVEKRLDIEVKAAEAEQAYSNFERETDETVHQVRELGKTGMDITAKYHGRTASGGWEVEVRKSNYTLYIVVAAIVGIVALIYLVR